MLGIAVAVVLLVSVGLTVWVELLFPAWILLLSIDILRTGLRRSRAAAGTAMGPQALSMLATGCHRESLGVVRREVLVLAAEVLGHSSDGDLLDQEILQQPDHHCPQDDCCQVESCHDGCCPKAA